MVGLPFPLDRGQSVGQIIGATAGVIGLALQPFGTDCVRQDGVNWEMVISTARQVVVSAAMVASSLAAMPAMVSSVR
jgi:hypothetical protein